MGKFFLTIGIFSAVWMTAGAPRQSVCLDSQRSNYSVAPRFAVTPLVMPVPDQQKYTLEGMGFLRNGDLVLYDYTYRRNLFVIHNGNAHSVPLGGIPSVSNDGELECFQKNAQGNMAIFRYRQEKWVQVTPLSAHYSDTYVQNEDGLGVATVKAPNGPWWAVEMKNGKEIDLRPMLKTKYSRAFAVDDEGAILLGVGDSPANTTFFWWHDGKIVQKVKMPIADWSSRFHLTAQRGFLLQEFGNQGSPTMLVNGEQAHEVRGFASPLKRVTLGYEGWLGGTEEQEVTQPRHGTLSRAVLVVANQPLYLDNLVEKEREPAPGIFSFIFAISRAGCLIARGGSKQCFLLIPIP